MSPVSSSCLFPGDRLLSYGIICDTSPYLSNPRSVSLGGCPRSWGCWAVCMVRGCLLLPSCVLREVRGGSLGGSSAWGCCCSLAQLGAGGQTGWWDCSLCAVVGLFPVCALVGLFPLCAVVGLFPPCCFGTVLSLCFPPGQEAAIQHDAFPGVGQLCFLSLPGGGSRFGELEPLQRLGGLLPHQALPRPPGRGQRSWGRVGHGHGSGFPLYMPLSL